MKCSRKGQRRDILVIVIILHVCRQIIHCLVALETSRERQAAHIKHRQPLVVGIPRVEHVVVEAGRAVLGRVDTTDRQDLATPDVLTGEAVAWPKGLEVRLEPVEGRQGQHVRLVPRNRGRAQVPVPARVHQDLVRAVGRRGAGHAVLLAALGDVAGRGLLVPGVGGGVEDLDRVERQEVFLGRPLLELMAPGTDDDARGPEVGHVLHHAALQVSRCGYPRDRGVGCDLCSKVVLEETADGHFGSIVQDLAWVYS